jgi:hypothetical protein
MSQDPVRLLDDPSLPDLLREDLADAAQQPLPPVDMAAGLASLKASIGAGGAVSSGAAASATAKAAALAHGSWWGGAWIGFSAGLVGAAAIWLAPSPASAPPPPRIEIAIESESAIAIASHTAAPPIAAPASPPAPLALRAASSAALSASAAPRAASSLSAPAPSVSAAASASAEIADGPAEELALLVQIKQSASSDPARAVALVDEGHRRFPRGSFYQERESIAVLALAQIGRTSEARERAKHFLDAHPQSPYAERLRGFLPLP